MKGKDPENIRRLTAAIKDAYRHPPESSPNHNWREGVMAEIRALAEGGAGRSNLFYVPRILFRVVPLMAAASLILFIAAWSAMGSFFNDLAVSVLTELPF
ncbi:MAG TPA: hypothetical protein ENH12_03400 [Proteobacteria bacterium]|nr:hypothetical protein [Pseudomonadota bacterium]